MLNHKPSEEEIKASEDSAREYGLGWSDKAMEELKKYGYEKDDCNGSRLCHFIWYTEAFIEGVEWQKKRGNNGS